MLATCIFTIESLGKRRFHSLYFALDYKVGLFFVSFSCFIFANELQPNHSLDSAAAISSSRSTFPRVKFKV